MTIREIWFSFENSILVFAQVFVPVIRISNREVVLLSLLLELLHVAVIRGQIFTNEFAVQVIGGNEVARNLAEEHGFAFHGQIGNLEGYYLFEHHGIQKRSLNTNHHHHTLLMQNPSVLWVEQQHVKHRVKRDTHDDRSHSLSVEYPDPLYSEQWFLHGGGKGGFDMNVLPAWAEGITGKGVVVSILDDGIQTNHPDLAQNYDRNASLDINGNDNDPMPQDNGDNKHGTRCAGEVASVAFNEFCGVGVAYNASIGGVRMLDGTVTDATEATALSHNPGHIDIYSASWGPEDDGKTVDGPGPLAKQAFTNGITKGRNGLGSIFVWASGNGGRYGDSCNCDGYTNSIYTLSISSATQAGYKPWYLEQCSSTLATTYSSGTLNKDKSIATADMDTAYFRELERGKTPNTMSLCTQSHTGTSASAPIAAAICALALEVNRKLTWRDMQYLVLMTSRFEPLSKEDGWVKNAVGRQVSSKFGYGLMDAAAMVKLAKQWTTVPSQHQCVTPADTEERIIPNIQGGQLIVNMTTDSCRSEKNVVTYLEHVQVKVTLHFVPRGNLKIILKSPSGTPSTVLLPRPYDVNDDAFNDWPFMSVHFWGERAEGNWKLIIINEGTNESPDPGKLVQWSLILHGTESQPVNLKNKRTEYRSPKVVPHGHHIFPDRSASDQNENILSLCLKDKKFRTVVYGTNCVEKCPLGQYGDFRDYTCHNCDYSCHTCYGPSYYNCLSCSGNMFLWNSTCVETCSDGFYADDESRECLPCSTVCAKCHHNRSVCTSCTAKMFLHEHSCYASCPSGTFPSNDVCKKCHFSCNTCSGPLKNECLSCKGTYLQNGTCIPSCHEGYYSDSNKKCRRCHGSCKSCVNKTACSPCWRNPEILESDISRNLCVYASPCSSEQSSTGNCEPCSGICRQCSDPTGCVVCADGFLWSESERRCIQDCPDGTYSHLGECYSCDETCMKCVNEPPEKCVLCKHDLVLHNGSCHVVCPQGFYEDGKHHCKNCHPTCLECTGGTSSDCSLCHLNSFLMNNRCYSSCPKGSYAVPGKGVTECVSCYHLCKTCIDFGPLHCTSCYDNSSFIGDTCVPCLDDEYFETETKSCQQCHDKCGRCNGPSENSCLTCQAPLRYDKVNHICLPCCDNNGLKGVKCCGCSGDLDDCINSSDHPRSIYGVRFDSENMNEVVIPMKHVVPVVIAICMSAVVLYVILFGILQASSRGWCSFKSYGKQYERVPNHLGARFDSETEKVLLAQDDPDEDDDIYEKA